MIIHNSSSYYNNPKRHNNPNNCNIAQSDSDSDSDDTMNCHGNENSGSNPRPIKLRNISNSSDDNYCMQSSSFDSSSSCAFDMEEMSNSSLKDSSMRPVHQCGYQNDDSDEPWDPFSCSRNNCPCSRNGIEMLAGSEDDLDIPQCDGSTDEDIESSDNALYVTALEYLDDRSLNRFDDNIKDNTECGNDETSSWSSDVTNYFKGLEDRSSIIQNGYENEGACSSNTTSSDSFC